MKMVKRIAAAGVLALALAACGGGGGGNTSGGGASGNLTIGADGENLAFDKTTLTAPAGQISVQFNNTSTANQHNWVLVNGGDDVAARVDEASIAAGPDKGYIPEGPDVLVHTNLLNPGENGTATGNVTAGTYTYICTVPGHYAAGMKGTLTVQ
jgi:uncharacterized cupredoxin-like copper-binding protein